MRNQTFAANFRLQPFARIGTVSPDAFIGHGFVQEIVQTTRIVDVGRGHSIVTNKFVPPVNIDVIFVTKVSAIPFFGPTSVDVFLRFFSLRSFFRSGFRFPDFLVFFPRVVLRGDFLERRVNHLTAAGFIALFFQVFVKLTEQ